MVKLKTCRISLELKCIETLEYPGYAITARSGFGFVLIFGRQTVLTAPARSEHLDESAHTPRQTRVHASRKHKV